MGLREYGDVPATRTWAEMIKNEIILIKQRLTAIENTLGEMKGRTGAVGPVKPEGEPGEDIYAPINIYEVLVATAQARRALYGYSMLLQQMGLSKEQKMLIRELEQTTSMVLRLTQAINLMMMAAKALETSSPWAIPFLILAGGMFAATLGYGMKLGGGGE